MNKTFEWIVGLVVLIVLIFWGYSVLKGPSVPASTEPIKIGFSAPLTGGAAEWGLPIKDGAEIALNKINSEGGINGRKLELVFEDDKCDGKEAVTAATKLINFDKVPAILGSVCSSAALAIAPLGESNKVVLLSAGASAPSMRAAGDYTFSIYPPDDYESGYSATFAYDKLGKRKAAILYANNDYGKGTKDVAEKKFKEKGGEVVAEESYVQDSGDFRNQLLKIKKSSADVLFIWGNPGDAVTIFKEMKEIGINIQVITSSVIIEGDVFKDNRDIIEGVTYSLPETDMTQSYSYLKAEYLKKFNKTEMSLFPTLGYDVVTLIANAMKKVGTNPTKIKDYLYTVQNFPGSSGILSFDKDGEVAKGFNFMKVENGQFVPYNQ